MTPYEALKLSEKITDLFLGLETDLMQNIANQIATDMDISSTSQWRIRKLAQLGALDKQNIKAIAQYAGIAPDLIQEAIESAALEEIKKLDPAYQRLVKAGILEGDVPQKISPELANALKAFEKQAQSDLNLVNTVMKYKAKTAFTKIINDTAELAEKQAFLDILGKNTGGVVTGSMARTEALRKTLKEFSEKGIPAFVDKSGREWTPEAYVNMDIRTTVNNVAHQTQFNRMDEYGIDLIEVSSHAGARPLCAEDQGKIFDRSNKSKKYPHWKNSSYGKPAGILGINCGHQIYPYVEGVNIQRYFPAENRKENDRFYKISQQQRALERKVRQQKRECTMLDSVGDKEGFNKASIQLKKEQDKLKAFCESKGRTYRPDRTATPGYNKTVSSKAYSARKVVDNKANSGIIKEKEPSEVRKLLQESNIEYNEVKKLSKPLSDEEIIQRLGGGDMTKGSCSSLAFAYIGNKSGLDVLDFRGGQSQQFFSRNKNIANIAKLDGVKNRIVKVKNEIIGARDLLKDIEYDKHYYLAVGKHAAIVRKTKQFGFEYLELQSATNNGFNQLTTNVLSQRFGATKTRTIAGQKYESTVVLIDGESLKGNTEFEKILGYINTSKNDQMKGVGGHTK